jgi:hypothetical protein
LPPRRIAEPAKRRRAVKISTHSFDLDYRPRTYFWPHGLKPHPLSSIKGANRRSLIAGVLAEDLDANIPRVLLQPSLPEPLRQFVGSLHPSGMGGEYLPDLIPNEVEIARITIASTTQDVTCVYPPTGRVRIAAPKRMKLDTVRVFAISKLGWIRKQQEKLRRQEREPRREYLDRESHYV